MTRPRPPRPSRLILPAYAKINLGLQIVGKRTDGYHELRTVYQTISLCDEMIFESAPSFRLSVIEQSASRESGRSRPVALSPADIPTGEDNLVTRAARLFARASRVEPEIRVTLRKRIPAGAGLGGGSSDAAVTLAALNRLYGFPLDLQRLTSLAAALGSDVPFFLAGGTALGLGRGEIVHPLRDIEKTSVLLLVPEFRVSTAEAYGRVGGSLTPGRGQLSIYRFCRQGVRGGRAFPPISNDLEKAIVPAHPSIGRLVNQLRSAGAAAAAMTGSGSAVYALLAGGKGVPRGFRSLMGSSTVVFAWLGRTVGAAEYSARVLGGGAASPRF